MSYENILTPFAWLEGRLRVRRGKLEQVRSREECTERVSTSQEFFERNCCIQGYHNVYKEVWEAVVGEALMCEGEIDVGRRAQSTSDRYTVAIKWKELS